MLEVAAAHPRRACVLVVDDEPAQRHGLCRLIQQTGYRVLEAGSVAAAKGVLDGSNVDVVVLDVGLPDGNGLSLLNHPRLEEKSVGAVVLTASRDRADLQTALERGATSYLAKGADELTVQAQIEIALRQVEARREAATQRHGLESALAESLARWDGLPRGMAEAFCAAWDLRHIETGAHVRRIGSYSEVLALALGFPASDASRLGEVAVLHDLGKVAIPDAILCKAGPLTSAELEIMKRHTVEGAKMLGATKHPFFEQAALVALRHHERWDGSGYPDGLRGDACPLEARIVAVADVYDALGHARCYKSAWTDEQIRRHFLEASGKLFEARIVDALLSAQPQLRRLAAALPDSGTLPSAFPVGLPSAAGG